MPAALLSLLMVLPGFCVTKTNELIIPFAKKVSVFIGVVDAVGVPTVIFPPVLLEAPIAVGALVLFVRGNIDSGLLVATNIISTDSIAKVNIVDVVFFIVSRM
jgi:hypothetical protein